MVGLVGEGAHVLRADIDQVTRMMRPVGEPGADPVAAFDQIDPLAWVAAPEQVNGGHDAAEAGADHGDPAAFACHRCSSLVLGSAHGDHAASVNTLAARALTNTSSP